MTIGVPVVLAAVGDLPPPADPVWRMWLTRAELAYCGSLQRASDHLAARALAKKAAALVLDWPWEVPWQAAEITRRPLSAPVLTLAGPLDRWRAERGLPVPGVSLTHAGGHAAAIAWLPGAAGRPGGA
jgi:holo-[acyl-carrier protein] synthase